MGITTGEMTLGEALAILRDNKCVPLNPEIRYCEALDYAIAVLAALAGESQWR